MTENTILKAELFRNKQLLYYVSSDHKNGQRLYPEHNETVYFCELPVRDLNDLPASFHDVTIKCFCNDEKFKAIIVSGSDVKYGRIGLRAKRQTGKS